MLLGKLCGIVFVIAGAYALLLGYRIVPVNSHDPNGSRLWHRKFGRMMKIVRPILILGGILSIFGVL